ncbi:MAG: hypothetical protein OHK0023_16080 [Anaerolineae bacterium]
MSGFVLLLVLIGFSMFGAVFVLVRLRQDRHQFSETLPESVVQVNLLDNDDAVIVAEGRGRLSFANARARSWFNLSGGEPNLEVLADTVQPAETFLELFSKEGHASFRVGARRVEASSHYVPRDGAMQMVVIMREIVSPNAGRDLLDPAKAMVAISEVTRLLSHVEDLNETLDDVLRVIGGVIPFDVAEINLWDEARQVLLPFGRSGDVAYFDAFENFEGYYRLEDSCSGWIARYRQPLLIADTRLRPDVSPKLESYPFRSLVGAPLLVADRLLGSLELASRSRVAFDHEDLALVQVVAGQLAIAIENNRLQSSQSERAAELTGLQQIAGVMTSLRDPRQMYGQLSSRIALLTNVEMCGILLEVPEEHMLVAQPTFYGVPETIVGMYRISLREDSPARIIYHSRDYWYSNNVLSDDIVRLMGLNGLAEAVGVQTTALVQMRVGNRRFGVIQVSNKKDGSGFSESDIRLLSVFAAQSAIVVENARLYEEERRRSEELTGLQQLSTVVGALQTPDELYAYLNEHIAKLMNCQMCGILLHDESTNQLVSRPPFYGVDADLIRHYRIGITPGTSFFRVYTELPYWIANELRSDPMLRDSGLDKLAMLIGVRQTLMVPLVVSGRRLGMVQVSNRLDGSEFTEEHARVLSIISAQAAVIIDNARLYREMRERSDESEGLRRVAEIASSSKQLSAIVSEVVPEIASVFGVEICVVALLDDQTGALVVQPEWTVGMVGLQEPLVIDTYRPEFQHSVALSRRVFVSNNVRADSRPLQAYRELADRFGLSSVAQVPLAIQDRSFGELTVASRIGREFHNEEVRLLQTIAVQLAAAVDRQKLYQGTDADLRARLREMDALARISYEQNRTTQFDRIMEVIRNEAQRTTNANYVSIALFKAIEEWSTPSRPSLARRFDGTDDRIGMFPIEMTAAGKREVILVENFAASEFEAMPSGMRAGLAAPIIYSEQVVGVLYLAARSANVLLPQTADFAKTLTNQIAISIGNEERFREQMERAELLKQRTEQLEQLFELGRMLSSETEIDEVLEAVAHAVSETIGYNIVVMSLVDKAQGVSRRVAQSGLTLAQWQDARMVTPKLSNLDRMFLPKFRMSNSYFLPAEDPSWQHGELIQGVVPAQPSNNPRAWRPEDALIVPLRDSAGELIGLMSVDDPRSGLRPTLRELESLETFGYQAAFAIENYNLLQAYQSEAEATRRERDRLEKLYRVGSDLGRAPDISARLQVVAEAIQSLGWSRVAVTLRDNNYEPLETVLAGFSPEDSRKFLKSLLPGVVWTQRLADPELRNYRLSSGYFIRYNNTLITEIKLMAGVVSEEEEDAPEVSTLRLPTLGPVPEGQWHPLDTLYLPLYGSDLQRLIGIITLSMPEDGQIPTETTLRPIELFAQQAASILENLRLYQDVARAAQQETRINQMMETVTSTLDLNEIILGVADGFQQMIAFTRMSFALLRDDSTSFEVIRAVISPRGTAQLETAPSLGVVGTALGLSVGEPIPRIYDLTDESVVSEFSDLRQFRELGERTALIVPMIAGGRAVGSLHMGSELAEAFGFREQLDFVARIANLTAVAIENAQLLRQTIDRERFSMALSRVGQSVNAMLDMRQVLDTICAESTDILSVDGVYVWLLEGDQMFGLASRGPGQEVFPGSRIPVSDQHTLAARAIRERKPFIIDRLQIVSQNYRFTGALADTHVETMMSVPLIAEGNAIGALSFVKTTPEGRFTDQDMEKATAFAIQASIAIQNARLYQETLGLTSFNEAVIQSIQQGIVVVDTEMRIRTLNQYMERSFGWSQEAVGKLLFTYRPEYEQFLAPPLAKNLLTGEPQSLTDIATADSANGATAANAIVTNFYIYPLQESGKISGSVILIEDVTERTALQADVARRAQQLSMLTEVSGQLTAALDPQVVTAQVFEQLHRFLDFDRATLWLRRNQKLVIQAAQGFFNAESLVGIEADINDSELFRDISSRGQVLNIPDIREDSRFPMSMEQPTRSWLGVSLVARNNLIGLLVLEKDDVGYFSATMEQLALTYANQVAVAYENAELFQQRTLAAQENSRLFQEASRRATELDQQAKRLTLLNRVSSALTQTLDLEDIFEVALRETIELLGVENGGAYVFDSPTQLANLIIEHPRTSEPPSREDALSFDEYPIINDVRRMLTPLVITDSGTDSRPPIVPRSLRSGQILSQMVVPLAVGGTSIGMMLFSSIGEQIEFRSDQIEIAQTIASQAAIAIQNANLLEQSFARTRELETLFEATQSISATLNFDAVIQSVAQQMNIALQADACEIMTLKAELAELSVELDLGMSPNIEVDAAETRYRLADYPTFNRAVQSRQIVLLRPSNADLSAAEKSLLDRHRAASIVVVPMAVREQIVGLVALTVQDPNRAFSPSEIRLARTLASQAAVALENASLQTETAAKLQELFNISEFSTALAASIDEEEIVEVVRERLPKFITAQRFYMAILSEDGKQISYPVALHNNEPVQIKPHAPGKDEVSFIMESRTSQRLVGEEIRSVLNLPKSKLKLAQAKAFLGTPLISGDQVFGALIVADDEDPLGLDLSDQRVLNTVGAQVSVAVQNARLFSQARRFTASLERAVQERTVELQRERDTLTLLYELTAELTSSLNVDVTLERALIKLASAVNAEMGVILSVDPISDGMLVRAQVNMPYRQGESAGYSQFEGLPGWVIQTQQAVVIPDVQSDYRWLQLTEFDSEPRSALVTLLEAGEEIQGVVMLFNRAPDQFSVEQIPLVNAATKQIANAINNADLYSLIREQAERLAAMVRREQVDSTKNLAIVESIVDGVMVANQDGDITQFNNAAERILDLPRQQVIGNHISVLSGLYAAVGGQNWLDTIERWTEDPASHRLGDELRAQITLESGKIISVILSPVNMGDQFLGTVSVFRDITREVEVDRLKSEFVATVSHELRTPMTSIKGYSDLLLLGAAGPLNEAQNRYLSTIKTNADKLSILVNELLDISRLDRGAVKLNLQAVNVEEIIALAVRHLEERIQTEHKTLHVKTTLNDDLPLMMADFDKLTQIMTHLVNNAFNYTYAEGVITLGATSDNDSVVLTITDTGVGIPKEKQSNIWNRFYRDEDERLVIETSGAGLGLSIVREYVRMHEGDIWLESEPKKGTTFFVRIPAYVAEEDAEVEETETK